MLIGRYAHLIGDAADSPIVETESQFYGGARALLQIQHRPLAILAAQGGRPFAARCESPGNKCRDANDRFGIMSQPLLRLSCALVVDLVENLFTLGRRRQGGACGGRYSGYDR